MYRVIDFESSDRLFSVPVDGSQGAVALIPFSPFIDNIDDLLGYGISADSTRVVFVGSALGTPLAACSATISSPPMVGALSIAPIRWRTSASSSS